MLLCSDAFFSMREYIYTVTPVLSGHSKQIPKFVFQDGLWLNAGQKFCRMLQGEHSAILLTFIKLPFVIKIFVLFVLSGCFTQVLLYHYSNIAGTSTCNFDSRNLCTWTNDHQNDQFDWQLRNGRTPSGQTGPTNDHTKGNAQGMYYITRINP